MFPMRAALEALWKAMSARPHKYLRRVDTGRTTASGSPIYRYYYVNPSPGRAFSVEVPGDGSGGASRGWDDVVRRDGAVIAALRSARGVAEMEAALRGVRHREFVVGIGRQGLTVRASTLLPRAEVDYPRIVTGNQDVRVLFPEHADVVIVTHNHAAMTPLSAGDAITAIKNGVREVHAVVDSGTWKLRLERVPRLTDERLATLRDDLENIRGALVQETVNGMPDGAIVDLPTPGSHTVQQVAEDHVDGWTQQLEPRIALLWLAAFRGVGVRARLAHVGRRDGALGKSGAAGNAGGGAGLHGSTATAPAQGRSLPAEGLSLDKAAGVHHVPYDFHPVTVEPPQRKRAKFPFQGFIDFQGIRVDVENLAGSYREGVDGDGHKWRVKMHAHYGEVRGTEGVDGDPLDVYVLPNADSSLVVVVHQNDPVSGAYDECKAILGARNVAEALALYRKQYDRPGFYGGHTAMPIGAFWRWVHDRDRQGEKVTKGGMMGEIWVPIPEFVYERLLGLSKAAGHKYLKKVPAGTDPKTGKQRWRYYYQVTGGAGHVAAEDDLVKVGAAFRLDDGEHKGHFHVTAVDGDQVTLEHDESGKTVTMSARELKLRLHRQHARAIVDQRTQARERRMKEFDQAKKTGTKAQQERAKARARAAGAKVDAEVSAPAGASRPAHLVATYESQDSRKVGNQHAVVRGGRVVVDGHEVFATIREDAAKQYAATYNHVAEALHSGRVTVHDLKRRVEDINRKLTIPEDRMGAPTREQRDRFRDEKMAIQRIVGEVVHRSPASAAYNAASSGYTDAVRGKGKEAVDAARSALHDTRAAYQQAGGDVEQQVHKLPDSKKEFRVPKGKTWEEHVGKPGPTRAAAAKPAASAPAGAPVRFKKQEIEFGQADNRVKMPGEVAGGWAVVTTGERYKRSLVVHVESGGVAANVKTAEEAKLIVEHLHEAGLGSGDVEGANRQKAAAAIKDFHAPTAKKKKQARASEKKVQAAEQAVAKIAEHAQPPTAPFTMTARTLDGIKEVSKRLQTFASSDLTRHNLSHIQVKNGRAVATDGHRLVVVPAKGVEDGYIPTRGWEDGQAIGAGAVLAKPLDNKGNETEFPDVDKVIWDTEKDREYSHHRFDPEALRTVAEAALKHAAAHKTGKDATAGFVGIVPGRKGEPAHAYIANGDHFDDDNNRVPSPAAGAAGTTDRGSSLEKKADEPRVIYLNASYLKDAIAGAKGPVSVRIGQNRHPVAIHRGDGEHHIVMPMNLGDNLHPDVVAKHGLEKVVRKSAGPYSAAVEAWAAARAA